MSRLSRPGRTVFAVSGGLLTAAATLALLAPTRAQAAGFAVMEQSASAQGHAYSGATAGHGGLSTSFFNPAVLSEQDGMAMSGNFAIVDGTARFHDGQASTVFGTPITGSDGNNLIEPGYVPAGYLSYELDPELTLGLAITAPYGFTTTEEPGWIGRYHALTSKVQSVDINPMVSYAPTDWISFGAGFRAMYFKARLSNAIDFGTIGASASVPGAVPGSYAQDGSVDLEGDDWAFGYTLGVLFEPQDGTKFGIGYRSRMHVNVTGEADFQTGGPVGTTIAGVTGQFQDTGGQAEITLPDTISFGASHDVDDKLTLSAQAAFTRWSSFDELIVQFDNPAQADNLTVEDWSDSWFVSVGGSYDVTDQLQLRLGGAFDQSASRKAEDRTPRIPDSNRWWLSTGAGYELMPGMELNVAYTRIFAPSNTTDLHATDPGNTVRGNLYGRWDSHANLFNVGLDYAF